MAEQHTITPDELQRLKRANAHGFVDFLTTNGMQKRDDKGQPVKSASGDPVVTIPTAEEAFALYGKCASFNEAVAGQVEQVKETIRSHIKAAAPAAA